MSEGLSGGPKNQPQKDERQGMAIAAPAANNFVKQADTISFPSCRQLDSRPFERASIPHTIHDASSNLS